MQTTENIFSTINAGTLLDNIKTTRIAYCSGVLLDPSGSMTWGFLICIFSEDQSEGKQIFTGNDNNSLKIRYFHFSNWGNWQNITTQS